MLIISACWCILLKSCTNTFRARVGFKVLSRDLITLMRGKTQSRVSAKPFQFILGNRKDFFHFSLTGPFLQHSSNSRLFPVLKSQLTLICWTQSFALMQFPFKLLNDVFSLLEKSYCIFGFCCLLSSMQLLTHACKTKSSICTSLLGLCPWC